LKTCSACSTEKRWRGWVQRPWQKWQNYKQELGFILSDIQQTNIHMEYPP
jgi:hypothetical protein